MPLGRAGREGIHRCVPIRAGRQEVMSAEGRRGGREARRAVRTSVAVRSLPALRRKLPLYEVLSPEQLDRVHDTAMRVLEGIGIDFREDEALALWAKAGAK